MLRLLMRFVFFLVFLRLLAPLIKGVGRILARSGGRADKGDEKPKGYSDLTPYEIEEADYEDLEGG